MNSIPESFKHKLIDHFGKEVGEQAWNGYHLPPSISVRVNTSKPTTQFETAKKVPWCQDGYLIDRRPEFAKDPLFHSGCYYVQDSSSMILDVILRKIKSECDLRLALDLCAAPGGKSLMLSDVIGPNGFVISNEVDTKRNAILSEVMMKWGIANHAITQLSSSKWRDAGMLFDLVLIDAPCSGEGMFRKDGFAIEQWSEHLISQCSTTQQVIIKDAVDLVKENGFLIYSTCTTNTIENEEKVKWLLSQGFEFANPELKEFESFLIYVEHNGQTLGHYLLPGISTGEGLFISVLKRISPVSKKKIEPIRIKAYTNSYFSKGIEDVTFDGYWKQAEISFGVMLPAEIAHLLSKKIAFKSIGLPAILEKGKDEIPLHGLAMHPNASTDIQLDRENALQYLRKQTVSLPEFSSTGWYLVGYENHPLGWIKTMPNRSNNYYPMHFRLRI